MAFCTPECYRPVALSPCRPKAFYSGSMVAANQGSIKHRCEHLSGKAICDSDVVDAEFEVVDEHSIECHLFRSESVLCRAEAA